MNHALRHTAFMTPEQISIPVAEPNLTQLERRYLLDAFDSGWVSSKGPYIERFEKQFQDFHRAAFALSVCNGTCALHLALLGLGIGVGDEVIVPTLSYVASANAIQYTGARPVFVDSEVDTWNLDATKLESALSSRTKAVLAVHLYGHPCDMDAIVAFARKHKLFLVEDVAEAFGSQYRGQYVGTLGDVAAFSFFGNKTITTGEGGMVITNSREIAHKILQLKSQGMSVNRQYYFDRIGYNYRMTNLEAALGLAQLERAETLISSKVRNAKLYSERLHGTPGIILPVEKDYAKNTYWMYSVILDTSFGVSRDQVRIELATEGIETRPFFCPCHDLPTYRQVGVAFPVAERISASGINLPSSTSLTERQIDWVCDILKKIRK